MTSRKLTARREMVHIIGKRKILLWKSSWRTTNIVWNQIYCSWGKKLIFCVKWIICQQCIFLLKQEEIILTAKSRLFTLGAKGFHLPQVDLSVRVCVCVCVRVKLKKRKKTQIVYGVCLFNTKRVLSQRI